MNKDDRAGLRDILEQLTELRDRVECVQDDMESRVWYDDLESAKDSIDEAIAHIDDVMEA